jgi:hypothetical protein
VVNISEFATLNEEYYFVIIGDDAKIQNAGTERQFLFWVQLEYVARR